MRENTVAAFNVSFTCMIPDITVANGLVITDGKESWPVIVETRKVPKLINSVRDISLCRAARDCVLSSS
jgi:hypothetical protein